MALQSRINEIYPSKKPFMEPADGNKRKSADLRVQAMLGAQEAAKRHCVATMQQEQMPPAQDYLHPQGSANQQTATDFSGFFNQLNKEKQQGKHPSSILQQSPQQNLQRLDDNPHQHNQHYAQHQHYGQDEFGLPHAGGLHNQQQQQGRQHSAVPTLDQLLTDHDLGSRHKPPDREIKHMMSLDRVFGADNSREGFTTASGCNRSNSSATAAAAAAAAAAKEQHSWHLTQMPYIPWDWSVKSSVRFSSAQPFNILEDAQGGGLECLCQAVAVAGGVATAGTAASRQERLQQALMQWQHPAAPLPPALLAAQASGNTGAVAAAAVPLTAGAAAAAAAAAGDRSKGDAAAVLLRERAQRWREALRGAYVALRHGHCPVLYVCGQAFKQPFTAVLCAPGVMGPHSSSSSGKFTAVISRTNRLLRAHLATYGCEGLVAGQLEQQAAAAAVGQQQQRQGKQQHAQQQLSAGAFDGQPGSQLLLVGVQHVHALYAALLALPWCEPGQPDVPLLSAPVPFLHAQLCPLRLVALPDALLDQQQQRQADAAGAPLPLHYMELRCSSSIMPWTLHRLLGLLQETQGLEGFQAYFGTEPCSSSLNALPELWTLAAPAAAGAAGVSAAQDNQQQQQQWRREGGGFSAAEVESWSGSAVLLHGRTLRQLKQEDGSISAKLA